MSLSDLRREYEQAGLAESDAGGDPFALFHRWFNQALQSGLTEPNAFTLASCSQEGQPSARIVLLKALDTRGFTFFTNYNSRKGHEMLANPRVAMVFLWKELERQVRIEGTVEKVTPAESDAYYKVRPLGSRLGAWASPQSEVIAGREILEIQHAELHKKYPDGDPPRPEHWGGYRVLPNSFEFWQGRPSRLHDRIQFVWIDGRWVRRRLAP